MEILPLEELESPDAHEAYATCLAVFKVLGLQRWMKETESFLARSRRQAIGK